MKHLAMLMALLCLAGCVSPAQRAENQKEMNASVPICDTTKQCDVAWSAAVQWVNSNCGMKIQTQTDNMIQTYNSLPDSPSTQCTVTKVMGPGQTRGIQIRVGCANMFGCVPKAKDQVIAFGEAVSAAEAPYAPLKIGVVFTDSDAKGNQVVTFAESFGLKVTKVVSNGRADAAGIQVGDIITGVNAKRVRNQDDWENVITSVGAGDKLDVEVSRSGATVHLTLQL